jgi:hypothetical protein
MLQQLLQEAQSDSVRQEACLNLDNSQEALRMPCDDAKMNNVFLSKRGDEHLMKLGVPLVVDDSPLFFDVSSYNDECYVVSNHMEPPNGLA